MTTTNAAEIFDYDGPDGPACKDPLRTLRQLWEALPGYAAAVEGYNTDEPAKRFPAQEALAGAVRKVFGLPEFDEQSREGFTEGQCLDLLWRFHDWLEKKSVNTASPPTSPPPMA